MKMKPAQVEVIEVPEEGFLALLGQQVEIRCNVYIYAGILVGVNDTCVKLDRMAIVYETGAHTDARYNVAQIVGDGQSVPLGLIESFGPSTKGD